MHSCQTDSFSFFRDSRAYEFDRNHDRENRVFLYKVQGNDRIVIYDSDIDHDDGAFSTYRPVCVDAFRVCSFLRFLTTTFVGLLWDSGARCNGG